MTEKKKTPPRRTFRTDKGPDPVTDYAYDVLDGTIVAGPHVRNACRRHIRDHEVGAERGLRFDYQAMDRVIGFFRDVLRLNGGQFDGKPFILQPMQAFIIGSIFGWKRADGSRRFRRAYIEAGKGCGKALALDTPIATPTGWSTMGELRVGDFVLDENGLPTEVIGTSDIMEGHDVYEVEFDDGEVIVADADHLWYTEKRAREIGAGHGSLKGQPKATWGNWKFGVRTTREIAETLRYNNGQYKSANHSIALTAPLVLPEANLPIDPYVLGVWLGDGDSDCARFTCADNDNETVEHLRAVGCDVGPRRNGGSEAAGRYRIGSVGVRGPGGKLSLNTALRTNLLLGNKHIPSAYLRGSIDQRLALLQGLMDTDGYIDDNSGRCEFTTILPALAEQVLELCRTLGLKATCAESVATLGGREIGPKWRIFFNAPSDLPVFRMQRKLDRQVKRHNRRRLSGDRKIVDCRLVDSVPVRCIRVSSPNSLFLAGRSMIPTHNSPLAGGIGLYMGFADGEAAAEVYAAGKDKAQAFVLYRDAVAMVEQSPALAKRITKSGGNPVWNMTDLSTASFFRPISREGASSGPRPYLALADELHEHPDGKVIEMLERGFKFRRAPLLFMITNSGSDRNSVCWAEHQHAVQVAAGTRTPDEDFTYVGETWDGSDATFSYVCALDKGDDPITDPACWAKANPLLGVTLQYEYIEGVVAQAKDIPSKRNGILRLHFCVWTKSPDTAWIPRPILDKVMANFDPWVEHRDSVIKGAGLDLSRSKDLTAAAFVVETGIKRVKKADGTEADLPTYDAWVEAWTPGDTMDERSKIDHVPYRLWHESFHKNAAGEDTDQPYLHAPEGARIRNDHVAAHLAKVDEHFVGIECLGYDKYVYDTFQDELDNYNLSINAVAHPQGGKKRAKPSEEKVEEAKSKGESPPLGLWMPGSVGKLEELILEERIRIRLSPVVVTALMGVAIETDPLMGNQWFNKNKATVRIDPAVALAMAVGVATDGVAVPAPATSPWDDPSYALVAA